MRRSLQYGAAVISAAIATLAPPSTAEAHNWTGSCTVNFDNLFALTWVYANARSTFAQRTGLTNGNPALCTAAHQSCWTYRHRCGANYVNVDDDSGYSHVHLSFEDPGFDAGHHGAPSCGFADPGDGYGSGMMKRVNGVCVTPDWKREPRWLHTHDNQQWVKVFLAPSGSVQPKIYDMPRIRIGGTLPVQLWFRKASTGQWFYWSSLAPGNWNLDSWVHDVDQVRIRAAAGAAPGPIRIDDFDILD